MPDVIGIGFAKCGTGALAFLDCHPSAVFRLNTWYYRVTILICLELLSRDSF